MASGLLIGATILSAAGSVYQGIAANSTASAQAKQSELSGESAMIDARIKAAELSKRASRLKGKQAIQAAAQGVDLSSTSLVSLQETSEKDAQEDINYTLSQGRMALATSRATASSLRASGQSSLFGSFFNAGTSILGGTMKYGKISGWKGFENF